MKTTKKNVIASKTIGVKLANGNPSSVKLSNDLYSFGIGAFGGLAELVYAVKQAAASYLGRSQGTLASFVSELVLKQAVAASERRSERLTLKQGIATANSQMAPTKDPSGVVDLNSSDVLHMQASLPVASQMFGGHKVTWTVMPWQLFHELPDCPFQRNTQAHATAAKHLKAASPLHAQVAAAELDGMLYKLDAHTRDHLQTLNKLEKPPVLMCTVIHCNTRDDIRKFYAQFDNLAAAEVGKDTLYGLYRSQGFQPKSLFMQTGHYMPALQLGLFGKPSARSPHDIALASKELVRSIDSVMAGAKKKFQPTVAGAVITAVQAVLNAKAPELLVSLHEFVARIDAKQSSCPSAHGPFDGVALLLKDMAGVRPRGGAAPQKETYCRALGALSMWVTGQTVSSMDEPLPLICKEDFDKLNFSSAMFLNQAVASPSTGTNAEQEPFAEKSKTWDDVEDNAIRMYRQVMAQ